MTITETPLEGVSAPPSAVMHAAKKERARVVAGGERLGGDLANGSSIAPTVFADIDNASDLAQQEIFDPVLAYEFSPS